MPGLGVSAYCEPAREVGGDYYDVFPVGEQQFGFLIADVSGKGVGAGLYMAQLKGLVLSLVRQHPSPRDLLMAVNRVHRRSPRRPQLHHDELPGRRPAASR